MQNTDFIARSDGAGDVLWSRGVCFGLVEGGCANLYWSAGEHIGACCGRVLSSVYCAKALHAQLVDMPLRRVRASPSSFCEHSSYSAEGKRHSREEKAPSRSGILLSMYVVLKTRYVNPNIHARRY